MMVACPKLAAVDVVTSLGGGWPGHVPGTGLGAAPSMDDPDV